MSVTEGTRPYRLAILVSHPIQYQAPLYRALAARPEIDLTVFFCSDWGLKTYRDEGFGQELKWDVPLLDGYRSEFLPNVNPKPNLSRFWGLINPAIIQRLRNGDFDAVWIHGWAHVTDWLAMLTAFASGIPVLLRGDSNLLPTLPRWKRILKRAVLTWLFRKVSGFLAIGRYNAEFYGAYGVPKEKIFYVPYAVDNDFFLSKAEELRPRKIELKRKFGMPEDLAVILFCGKLIPVKRPMDLLQVFAQLSKDVRCTLVFVGDGPLHSELEAYVQEHEPQHVYFMGFQNQTELPTFYAMADVFVLPSGSEQWGLVVNEAMCFGLPVIVSDQVGAGGDLVREGVNGFVYPAGDVIFLSARLKLLLTNASIRQKMGNASLEIIIPWAYPTCVRGVLDYLHRFEEIKGDGGKSPKKIWKVSA
jgi:glycosyltransferase involved in cell wall biosynthesis